MTFSSGKATIFAACAYCDWQGDINACHDSKECAHRQVQAAVKPLLARIEKLEAQQDDGK